MNDKDFIESIENTEKPQIELRTHKDHLLHVLSQELKREKNIERKSGIFMVSSLKLPKFLVPAMSVVLLLAVGAFFFTASSPATYVTMQVNPALEFALDKDNNVISVESLNEDAKLLINDLKLVDKELEAALLLIVGKANELGFVKPDQEFMIAFRSAQGTLDEESLYDLAKDAELAVQNAIVEANLSNEVNTAVISSELFETALKAGLLPGDYFDLIEENVSQGVIMEMIRLSEIQGIDPEKYFDEFDTVSSAAIDLLEAGVEESKIMLLLQAALATDKEIEEFSTIVAAMIDIQEAGGDPEQVVNLIKSAGEANISSEILLEEITTLTAAYIDMIDEGISAAVASAFLTDAMKADPSLEELSTLSAAFIDLIEDGVSEAEATKIINEAIKADPSLESFDDLIEKGYDEDEDSKDDEDIDDNEASEADVDVDEKKDSEADADVEKIEDSTVNVDVKEKKDSKANDVDDNENEDSEADNDEIDEESANDNSKPDEN